MMDVALHFRGRLQRHGNAANDARDLAAHDDALGGNRARYPALLADDHLAAADVALDLAIDLEGALADDLEALADDLEVVANHRFGAGFGADGTALRDIEPGICTDIRAAAGIAVDGLEPLGLARIATREHLAPGCLTKWKDARGTMPAPRRGRIMSACEKTGPGKVWRSLRRGCPIQAKKACGALWCTCIKCLLRCTVVRANYKGFVMRDAMRLGTIVTISL